MNTTSPLAAILAADVVGFGRLMGLDRSQPCVADLEWL